MWRHTVWQLCTNVSKEPAASNLYSSTQMLICLWSVNGYRRTQPQHCKSRGVTWPCRTAVTRPIITEIHKGLLLCICVMMGLLMAVRLKHVARCCRKNECFYNPAALSVFIYGTNIGMTVPKVYFFFNFRRFLKFIIALTGVN